MMPRRIKVMYSLPKDMIKFVEDEAMRSGQTRSTIVWLALQKYKDEKKS